MELSKDESIFKSIDIIKKAIAENKVTTLKIHSITDWIENEFNNFTSILRSNYSEIIDDEILEVKKDDNYLIISNLANIREYNNSNTYSNHRWENRTLVTTDRINDLLDVNFEVVIYDINEIDEISNWSSLNKTYRFIKKFNYDLGNGIIATASIVKSNDIEADTLRKSKILSLPQQYEFSLLIKDAKHLLDTIIIIIKALFLSNIILTKKQQQIILESYSSLVSKDMQLPKYFKEIPLLTPKPATLEKVNLVNPDEYGALSILRGYAVTEKADGERILMYINDKGKVFLISSSLKVEDTAIIAKKEAYNSLIDGEYVHCNKRTDEVKKNLFAAFDIYYLNGKSLTSLPLIQGRYEELMKITKLLDISKSNFEFTVKVHHHTSDILKDCKKILDNPHNYPYEIDGLIFTPAKLAVYSYYPSIPVPITPNMTWDKLFKWKPPEQNTIDFLIKFVEDVIIDGNKYKKVGLYVGFNPLISKEITIDEGLKLRYDKNYSKTKFIEEKEKKKNGEDYIPILFKPVIYYYKDVEYAFIKIDSKGDIRTEDNNKILNDTIVEFRYDIEKKQWYPLRIRFDKTNLYKKGIFSKTANSLIVALSVWRTIHNPISKELITGSKSLFNRDVINEGKELDVDDIYYYRGIPRKSLLSYDMVSFHNLVIIDILYSKSKNRNSLLELACGQAGGLPRWLSKGYNFILGIDYAKDNIYKANDGAYARMIKEYNRFNKEKTKEKGFFPNMIFAAGDCGIDIKSGASGVDDESKELMKIVMNNNYKTNKPHYKHIVGKGAAKFDVVTCMFAIHYFFENEEKLNGFLYNVASNLKTGGNFITTFMDGNSVERSLGTEGIVEGRKSLNNTDVLIWAIIKRFNSETNYNKRVDVFIENTQRLIPEYLVNFDFLIEKAKEFGLQLESTELYSESFQKLKDKINPLEQKQTEFDKLLLEFDKEEIQKKFSFLNRWVVFKKIDV